MDHAAGLAAGQTQTIWVPHGHTGGRATYWLGSATGPRGLTEFAILAGAVTTISQHVLTIREGTSQ